MLRHLLVIPALFATLGLVACGPQEAAVESNEDITSASSVERTFNVKGYVYVANNASAYTVQQAVGRQIRSAFGPLRIAKISVDDRELKDNVDPSAFTTEEIEVVKKTGGGGDTGDDLSEGSPNALGVLEMVNDPQTTVKTLDEDAGLASYAAKNVIDGRPYSTIAQLDAVYGIGKWSLQQMLKYAKAQGYVETGSTQVTVLKKVKRVSYSYRARALVANSMAGKTRFSFALLMPDYQSFVDDIIRDCVENYEHDQEFSSSFWYVWSPNEWSCKKRIDAEVQAIQSERQGLAQNQIGEKEYGRRYLPVTAQLESVAGPKTTYPEYDRLFGISDPAKKKVVVYQIVGIASHAGDPEDERFANDMGFAEFFKTIKVLADTWSKLEVAADSSVDPLNIPYNGKTYPATFAQIYKWTVSKSSFPSEIPSSERDAFRRAIHDHVYRKWIRLEVPVTVRSGHTHKQMTLQFRLLFGTDSGWTVKNYFKEAFKNGDLVLYDGHSYIGSGPLDPGKYTHYDFAQGRYQVFFFNSCVSFNYYGIDYFDLKMNGTKDLDLVTNGIEVWIRDGGKSMGQFIVAMLDGNQNTWLSVLKKTQVSTYWGTHDPNRAVDGEQDNTYDPNTTPISVKEGWDNQLDVQLQTPVCGSTASGSVQLAASAPGATRVEFFAGSAQIGSDSSQPFGATWDTTTVADGEVVLRARAVDGSGQSAEVTCTTTVKNGGGPPDPFFDDMEGGGGNWTATGLWHLAQDGSCAGPAYASAKSAWYFGQPSSCSFKKSSVAKGTLTSRDITGVTASSRLSFKFWREVESSSWGSYDKTFVEVSGDGGATWNTLWSRSSKDSSAKAWKSSGDISLAELAGKTIRVRFTFDSVDTYANDHVGWMIDDVRVN